MEKAVIDLGKSETNEGLTFVCLSWAKRRLSLLVQSIPFDRLAKLAENLL